MFLSSIRAEVITSAPAKEDSLEPFKGGECRTLAGVEASPKYMEKEPEKHKGTAKMQTSNHRPVRCTCHSLTDVWE